MNTTVRKLVVATGLAFAAVAAQAAPQSSWDYLVDVKWVNATFSTAESYGFTGITDNNRVVEWGAPYSYGVDYKKVNADPNLARSALAISDSPSMGSLYTDSGNTNVNLFTHYNSEISGIYKSLVSATFQVKVDLVLPNGIKVLDGVTKNFQVYFKETPNTGGDCAWGACNNDIFAIVASPDLTTEFTYDGQKYVLNYFESSSVINPYGKDAPICREAGIAAGVSCFGFTTAEKSITQAQFALSVTAVPEPETYAMLLAGLGIIGVVARRRTAK